MALKITWTPRAKKGYDKIIEYLSTEWTDKEVRNFVQHSFAFFDKLTHYPELLKASKKKNIRSGAMNEHTILTYRIKPRAQEIQLLNIRGARQEPLK